MFDYKYDFSIVMGYYNRKNQIKNTLDYFEKEYNFYNYEVIIVDDNSNKEHKLDDMLKEYTFSINHIVITPEEKGNRINPCVTYNRGFKEAKGKYVIIQNPECIHVGDVLNYVKNNLTDNDYIAFSCFSAGSEKLTNAVIKDINLINDDNFRKENREFNSKIIKYDNWYNHPVYRPVHYHFCAAIMNDNLKLLGGFNEEFAKGHSFDDNEILLSINKNVKLNIKTIGPNQGVFVIHQWHPRDAESKITKSELSSLFMHNRKIFEMYQIEHHKYDFQFPKLLHLYWDGSPLSYLNLLTVLSFNRYHIGWKINVFCPLKKNEHISWISKEQKTKYTGIDYFDELKKIQNVNIHYINSDMFPKELKDASEVIKSDYFRLYILNKFGGLWSDFDIIYTNSIEKYYKNKKLNISKKMIIYEYKHPNNPMQKVHPVGLFLSKKNNAFTTALMKYSVKFYDKTSYQSLGCNMLHKVFNFYKEVEIFKTILMEMNLKELYIDNADCYLKVKWNELDTFYKNKNVPTSLFEEDDNIFSIHWFNGADQSKYYCNNLNLDLLKNNKPTCLIDKFVKQYI